MNRLRECQLIAQRARQPDWTTETRGLKSADAIFDTGERVFDHSVSGLKLPS